LPHASNTPIRQVDRSGAGGAGVVRPEAVIRLHAGRSAPDAPSAPRKRILRDDLRVPDNVPFFLPLNNCTGW
jgi:hypothetical protein